MRKTDRILLEQWDRNTRAATLAWKPRVVLGLWLFVAQAHGGAILTTLFSFNGTNGAVPEGRLVQGADGSLYGTTIGGGTNHLATGGNGTVFRFSTNGVLTTLVFLDSTNGSNPQAGLLLASDGNFYGTAMYGGANYAGIAFKMSADGAYSTFCSFASENAVYPNGLAEGPDGTFYGTGYWGGTNGGYGTAFKIAADGTLTPLVSFGGTNGANPQCPLRWGGDGNFYGTTVAGGTNGDSGTIFKLAPDGMLTTLFCFDGTNGSAPLASPLRTVDGCLYGTTSEGGTGPDNTPTGNGTIYRLAPDGTFTTLVVFDNTNGALSSFSGLLPAADGYFYGTTERGGTFQRGTIFRMTTNGILTTLASFSPTDGAAPAAGLMAAADGSFYGVTMFGGQYDQGTIFRLSLTPDPPRLRAALVPGGGLGLSWDAIEGRKYQLQSSASLAPADWHDLGAVIAARNSTAQALDLAQPDQARFYQVVLLP